MNEPLEEKKELPTKEARVEILLEGLLLKFLKAQMNARFIDSADVLSELKTWVADVRRVLRSP